MTFDEFRKKLFDEIDYQIEQDGHHKSYEGAMEIESSNRFQDSRVTLEIHCYVIGCWRHHKFDGTTLQECVDKADAWLTECIAESRKGDW